MTLNTTIIPDFTDDEEVKPKVASSTSNQGNRKRTNNATDSNGPRKRNPRPRYVIIDDAPEAKDLSSNNTQASARSRLASLDINETSDDFEKCFEGSFYAFKNFKKKPKVSSKLLKVSDRTSDSYTQASINPRTIHKSALMLSSERLEISPGTFDNIASVRASPGGRVFCLHASLLAKSSQDFDDKMNACRESKKTLEIQVEGTKDETLESFATFLYRKELTLYKSQLDDGSIFDAYVFGTKRGSPYFQNAFVDAFIKLCCEARILPHFAPVTKILSDVSMDCALIRLLADLFADKLLLRELEEKNIRAKADVPPSDEFLNRIKQAARENDSSELPWNLKLSDISDKICQRYHLHGNGPYESHLPCISTPSSEW